MAAGGPVLSDRIGPPPGRLAASRRDPFRDPVREVGVGTEGGEALRIAGGDLDAPAEGIAALHGRRRGIEPFFRWVERTPEIEHLLGRSENAARVRLAVALIAFLLLRLAHRRTRTTGSPTAFRRLVRADPTHRRAIGRSTAGAGRARVGPRRTTRAGLRVR